MAGVSQSSGAGETLEQGWVAVLARPEQGPPHISTAECSSQVPACSDRAGPEGLEDFKQYFVTPLYTASVPALEVHRKHQTIPSLQLGKQSRDIPFEAQSGTLLPTRIPPGRRLVDSQGWESVPFPRVLLLAPRKKTARCCSKVVTALDPCIYNYYCLLKVSTEGKKI